MEKNGRSGEPEKREARMKRIINRITTSIVVVLLGLTIVTLIGLLAGVRAYVVKSGSMEPAIQTGSLCFVNTNAAYGSVETGDIIAFETAAGAAVTHRAVQITTDGIETKGDANEEADLSAVQESSFLGVTMFSIPYLGYLTAFLQTKRGIILAVSFITALIIAGIATDRISPEEDLEQTEE